MALYLFSNSVTLVLSSQNVLLMKEMKGKSLKGNNVKIQKINVKYTRMVMRDISILTLIFFHLMNFSLF